MMQHLTGQKSDKFLSVNCRRGFQDPGRASRKHIGTFPAHLQQFVGETHFPCFLDLLLQELALRQGPAGQPPQAVHVLLWCNDGTHLSVSASRVVEVAAAALGIPCPSCTSTSPPHPTCGVLRNQHFRRCVCFNSSDVKIQSLAILHNFAEVRANLPPFCTPVAFARNVQHVLRLRRAGRAGNSLGAQGGCSCRPWVSSSNAEIAVAEVRPRPLDSSYRRRRARRPVKREKLVFSRSQDLTAYEKMQRRK